jgi:hypothetical protein
MTSPQTLLHIIKGLGNDVISIGEADSNTRLAIGQEAGYTGNYINSRNIDLKFQGYCAGGSGGNIHFQTGTDGTGCVTSKMFICSTGNVGINSISPCARLHIQGTTTTDDLLYFCQGGAVNTKFVYSIAPGADDAFVLRRNHTTQGNLCIMSWTYNGRVGIGTITPSHTLDVNGTINASTLISLTRKYETNAVSFSTQAGATGTFNIDIAGLSGLAVAGNYQTADVYFQAGLYPGATTINGRIGVVGRGGSNTANLYAITCIGGIGTVTITPYGNGTSTFGLCLQSNCTSSFVYWKAIVNAMSV